MWTRRASPSILNSSAPRPRKERRVRDMSLSLTTAFMNVIHIRIEQVGARSGQLFVKLGDA